MRPPRNAVEYAFRKNVPPIIVAKELNMALTDVVRQYRGYEQQYAQIAETLARNYAHAAIEGAHVGRAIGFNSDEEPAGVSQDGHQSYYHQFDQEHERAARLQCPVGGCPSARKANRKAARRPANRAA